MTTKPQEIRARFNGYVDGNSVHNKILLNLPYQECQLFFPRLVLVNLRPLDVLCEIGEPIKYAYFMNSGLVSILNVMEDGTSVEVGLSGREGFVGAPALVRLDSSASRVIVQIAGSAYRVSAHALAQALRPCPNLENRLQRYVQVLGLQSAQLAGCNRLHQIKQRLARWLLMCHDGTGSLLVPMTHESLAHLLGTNRSSVTTAAGILQKAGLIMYEMGHAKIVDRTGLEGAACECYAAIVQQASKWIRESA